MSKLSETLQSYRFAGGAFRPETILLQLVEATESENIEDFIKWCVAMERGAEIQKQASYKANELMIELEKLERKLREGI